LTDILLAASLGGLLGDVFFHNLPHLDQLSRGPSQREQTLYLNAIIVLGIWCFFLLEKLTQRYLEDESNNETDNRFRSFAVLSIVADLIHNFTDGLSIGVSFAVDFKMGLVTTMAMFSHEIPHTFGDFAILF
jgi:zinc transporter ZupT